MAIFIVYLTIEGFVSLFALIKLCQYFVTSLGILYIFLWSLYWTKYVFIDLEVVIGRSSTK